MNNTEPFTQVSGFFIFTTILVSKSDILGMERKLPRNNIANDFCYDWQGFF